MLHGDPNDKVRLGRDDLSYGAMSARISPEAAGGMEENLWMLSANLRNTPQKHWTANSNRHVSDGENPNPHIWALTPTMTDSWLAVCALELD